MADQTPAPAAPKAKLTLAEQAAHLRYLRDRTRLSSGKDSQGAWMLLDAEDVKALDLIVDTLDLFAFYGADKFVRDEIIRRRKKSGK